MDWYSDRFADTLTDSLTNIEKYIDEELKIKNCSYSDTQKLWLLNKQTKQTHWEVKRKSDLDREMNRHTERNTGTPKDGLTDW